MAVENGLEVLFFDKFRDGVEIIPLRYLLPVELVKALGSLLGIAGLAGPHLVVDALDGLAGGAFGLDLDGLGDDMFPGHVSFRPAISAFVFGIRQLLVFPQDIAPLLLPALEFPEGLLDETVMLFLGAFPVAHVEGALRDDLGVLVINQIPYGLYITIRHG